jgi:hypothetical protein
MRFALTVSAILLASLAYHTQTASAQMGGMSGGQSGMFGSSSLGSGLSAGQRSAFGGSSGSGMGMGGQGGLGGLSGGNGGFGSQMGGSQGVSQLGGTVGGQARRSGDFVGATTNQLNGRAFVGAQQAAAGMGQGMQGIGNYGGGMQGYGRGSAMGQYGSGQSYNGQGGIYGNGRNSVSVRTALTIGADFPVSSSPQVSSSLAQRLVGLPAIRWRASTRVEMRGRTAVLRGVVATEHDRDLAERVVRLEAAVDQVENQIVVAPDMSRPVPSSAANSSTSLTTPAGSTRPVAAGTVAPAAANSLPALP